MIPRVEDPAGNAPDSKASLGHGNAVRAILLGVVFMAAWVGTSFLAGQALPFENAPGDELKFRYFAEHKDEFDTIFVGSSRVHFQIIPKQFDAETAAAGVETRSFNLASAGMWPPESLYFLRKILRLRPAHLKWVMIDLMDVNSRVNEHTWRAVCWHDWRHTAMAIRDVLDSPRDFAAKASHIWQHGALFLEKLADPGGGRDWLDQRLNPPKKRRFPQWAERAGFEPEQPGGLTGTSLEDFYRAVEYLKGGLPHQAVRAVHIDALREIAEEVRKAGATPIFILAPTIDGGENFAELPKGLTVLAFNDPAQYPSLFRPELHFDAWHLNEQGAAIYTHFLAERFAERRMATP